VPELDALLDRIGLAGPPPPTLDGLRTLHRAYVTRIPYEALAVQLGESGALDVDLVTERLLSGGRGGYCFELNAVLAWMLEQVGFEVERHEGVAGVDRDTPAPTNHLALVVPLGEQRWLADAGLGEGPIEPLPIAPGRHPAAASSPLEWTIEAQPDGGWWFAEHPFGSMPGFRMAAPVVELSAFDPHHRRLSTEPDSNFVRTLIVQRPYDDRIETLRSRTLSVDGPGRRERRVLTDIDELAAALDETFGIDPDGLGAARLERLWAQACAQHEAWAAARTG
jgi:N-hydroxyarylamine O-acetyltransferase